MLCSSVGDGACAVFGGGGPYVSAFYWVEGEVKEVGGGGVAKDSVAEYCGAMLCSFCAGDAFVFCDIGVLRECGKGGVVEEGISDCFVGDFGAVGLVWCGDVCYGDSC